MQIHHIGYLTKDIKAAETAFINLGYEIEIPAAFDSFRNITISFLKNGAYRVELIEPSGPESPMYRLLKKYKNTPYHICYETENLEETITRLEETGYVIVQEPLKAPCIENRCVAFLMGSDMGIIELLEKRKPL